jgi:hypothetical protein
MAGGVITTGSHPKLLWPGVHAVWGQMYAEHQTEYTQLYNVKDSSMAYETDVQVTGFGLAPIKPETQGTAYDSEVQGGITNYIHIPYSLGYIVSFEEKEDNQYKVVAERRARANAFSINQTVENVCAFLYNNAFVPTYFTTWDGVALLSNAHLNATGGTFSNILGTSTDLSEASLEDMCVQIMGATGDRGLLINIMPQSLHIHRSNWFNANRILKSVLQSGTANNDINVLKATNSIPGGIHVNHYFTSPGAWMLRTNCPEGMTMFWRNRPMLSQDNDFPTKNALAATYFRMSVGCTDPRGIYGSNGP